jgi:hypothetical protein
VLYSRRRTKCDIDTFAFTRLPKLRFLSGLRSNRAALGRRVHWKNLESISSFSRLWGSCTLLDDSDASVLDVCAANGAHDEVAGRLIELAGFSPRCQAQNFVCVLSNMLLAEQLAKKRPVPGNPRRLLDLRRSWSCLSIMAGWWPVRNAGSRPFPRGGYACVERCERK